MMIIWLSAEQHAPQCSALAAASEYCWLELRATQHCSSPAETVSGCKSKVTLIGIACAGDVDNAAGVDGGDA